MHDCSTDVIAFHNDEVSLSKDEQSEMRGRRDRNRSRLKRELEKSEKPAPASFVTLGSYSMHTMTQHDQLRYDIDDAVVFERSDLQGPQGADMSAPDARKMVRDALDDGSFKTPPALHTNCVRVQYDAGYQVDIPVYREFESDDRSDGGVVRELASSSWKSSDAEQVCQWFKDAVVDASPNVANGGQLRRVTRDIKKFANSRQSWESRTPSGFVISILVVECYVANGSREDRSLYDTMRAIRDRLQGSLQVMNPVCQSEVIADHDDAGCKFLLDKLDDAMSRLYPLLDDECERSGALNCWDKTFNTEYFSGRDDGESADGSAEARLSEFFAAKAAPNVRSKSGDNRFA